MTLESLIFYVLSAVLIFSAAMVVTVRNPIRAALFLVLAFFSCAALWILLQAEFLAITLVLVYVGAVMVLFLFVVMMLDVNYSISKEGFASYLPVGLGVSVVILAEMGLAILGQRYTLPEVVPLGEHYSNTRALGELLYTHYVYPFELAAVVLLIAIVSAIALTLRKRTGVRTQNPADQVKVNAEDRVRLVDLSPEKKG